MVLWDLQRLRILRELAERRTLTAVADALGYSPSAISQQMAVLEREAGTALMQRAGRGVRLTDAGRLLADHAGLLLAAAEAARLHALKAWRPHADIDAQWPASKPIAKHVRHPSGVGLKLNRD